MKTNMARTSLNAWAEEMKDTLPKRAHAIFFTLHRFGPMTDCELAHQLRVPINGITGARNMLMHKAYVFDVGKVKGPTGRMRTQWAVVKMTQPAA